MFHVELPRSRERLVTVHLRHRQVEHDQVDLGGALAVQVDGLLALVARQHGEAQPLERPGADVSDRLLAAG